MPYYVRLFALKDEIMSFHELQDIVKGEKLPVEMIIETGNENSWEQICVKHKNYEGEEGDLFLIEPFHISSEIGEDEVKQAIEEAATSRPESAAKWLQNFLPRVKTIFLYQILTSHIQDIDDGWSIFHSILHTMHDRLSGIFQADYEGFSNDEGYHITWDFSERATGTYAMAILDGRGNWIRFEADLSNRKHRNAMLKGKVPVGAKIIE